MFANPKGGKSGYKKKKAILQTCLLHFLLNIKIKIFFLPQNELEKKRKAEKESKLISQ